MRRKLRRAALFGVAVHFCACAANPPAPPYPAFVDVDALPDAFVAGLPGIRAKQLAADPRTQRASYRIEVPRDWSFTTGASPAHSVEIYVLAGAIRIGGFPLDAGGYAYLPAGNAGVQMTSDGGAMMLYFLDEADPAAVIHTPLIADSDLIDWRAEDVGLFVKELRSDPGSGARSWLLRVSPEAFVPFQRSSRPVEGYLVSGEVSWPECVNGDPADGAYRPGGYFSRPPGAVHGGPGTTTATGAVWYLRTAGAERVEFVGGCVAE